MPENDSFVLRAIVEIAGKPKEHIEQTMKLVMEKLKKEKVFKGESFLGILRVYEFQRKMHPLQRQSQFREFIFLQG